MTRTVRGLKRAANSLVRLNAGFKLVRRNRRA
jgi:hypothetical protein